MATKKPPKTSAGKPKKADRSEAPKTAAVPPAQGALRAKPKEAPRQAQPNKLSALDAAAQVLAAAGQPLRTQAMIEATASTGSWTSPTGQTPAATLYSAILREFAAKGTAARFVKTGRGTFAASAGA